MSKRVACYECGQRYGHLNDCEAVLSPAEILEARAAAPDPEDDDR